MTIVRNAKHLAAVVAALTGLSLTAAYAAPSYAPPILAPLSPLDTTPVDSESELLDNFNQYLSFIQAKVPVGTTLVLPASSTLLVAPTDVQYYGAVASAVADALTEGTATAEQIVSAAVQYKPGRVKDIVKAVVLANPASAPEVVAAAARAVPLRAADAATGAILGLIGSNAAVSDATLAAAADDAVIAQTRELIEKVTKAAVLATKTSATQGTAPIAVAEAIVDAFWAEAATVGSNGELFLDDLARGAVAGVTGFSAVTKGQMAEALVAKIGGKSGVTKDQVVNFAMGALKSVLVVNAPTGSTYAEVAGKIATAATALGGTLDGVENDIAAGAHIQLVMRQAGSSSDLLGLFSQELTAGRAPYVAGYVSGAVQALKGRAGDFVKLAFEDAEVGTLSLEAKKGVVAAAVTGNFGATSKAVTNAIINNSATNSLTAVQAVQVAIPASNELYSGAATLAAVRTVSTGDVAAGSIAVLEAAIDAAVSAKYQSALTDIALNAVKSKRAYDNQLIAAAIARVPAGWEEAVASFIIANNPKDLPDATTNRTNEQEAVLAATNKGADVASVQLAMNLVQAGKLSSKTVYDDAINAAHANKDKARAILFGAGVINTKLAIPLMSMLIGIKDGGDSNAQLKDYAIALNKRTKVNVQLAYEAAVDAFNYPDNVFDIVDHKILTNSRQAADILTAVVAVRPEYAHYAARAAAFRAPALVSKTAYSAVQFAHMRANRDLSGNVIASPDDPAAVAAISAAVVLGIKDAKLLTPAKQEAAIKAGVAGLVKAALAFQNPGLASNDPDKKAGLVGSVDTFKEANGNGTDLNNPANYFLRRTKGTAAVLTGVVAQLQINDPAVAGNELWTLNDLAKAAITAAAKAARSHSYALAQAAGAAAAAAAIAGGTVFTDFAKIGSAFLGLAGIDTDKAARAAEFGALQLAAGVRGAGAAGIMNYGHISGQGSPVSDLSNF